jgi:deazaflavin-dependent oxidoreductase (nitroreductase family)
MLGTDANGHYINVRYWLMATSDAGRSEWVQDHIDRYRASDGEDGHFWRGVPTLLLTTVGRQSGDEFTTPLVYGRSQDMYLVVASRGGAVTHPQWFLNLRANPTVKLQVAAEKFTATARIASPEEKAHLWPIMTAIWPKYDEYQQATERDIPLVILERQ